MLKVRLREYAKGLFSDAMETNLEVIRQVVSDELAVTGGPLVDLGCWDGQSVSKYIPTGLKIVAVEADSRAGASAARRFGWDVLQSDLNGVLPLPTGTFRVLTSNQVIEHLSDTDTFVSEVFRVLAPGGLAVISTENLASWHNIVSLVAGWQPFSLTNVSRLRRGIGNPLAAWRDEGDSLALGWGHLRVFAFRGLKELGFAAGFEDVEVIGSGYYPLPGVVAKWDPRHSAFLTLTMRKPR